MRPARRLWLTVAVAAIVLVAAIALWWARLPLAEALVMRAVASAGVAGVELAVTEMGPGGALLERVRLGDGEAADLEIERIAVRYTLLGMLRGHLGEVEVAGLRLRGRANASGVSFGKLDALREQPAAAEPSGGALWLPPIDALRLQDARVELATEGAAGTIAAEGIEGELAVAEGKPHGSLSVGAIRSERLPPVAIALQLAPEGAEDGDAGEIPIVLEVSTAEGRARLGGAGSLRVDPPGGKLALTGTIEFAPGALQPADLAPARSSRPPRERSRSARTSALAPRVSLSPAASKPRASISRHRAGSQSRASPSPPTSPVPPLFAPRAPRRCASAAPT
jgi:hypothetical protein